MTEVTFDFSNLAEFDAIAQSIAAKLNCALSLVSVVQGKTLVALGHSHADTPVEDRETLARDTVCVHTMAGDGPVRIPDIQRDQTMRNAPAVAALQIGAYLGVPLRINGGTAVGALCALATSPRLWTNAEVAYLEAMADLVESKIERLVLRYEQEALSAALAENDAILSTLAAASGNAITVHNAAGELVFANDATRDELELTFQELLVLPHAAQRLAEDGARSGAVSVGMPGRPSHALHVELHAPNAGLTLAEWRRS